MKQGSHKLISLLLSLILVFQLLPAIGVSAEEQIDYYGRQALSNLDNSEALLYAYDQILAGVAESAAAISVYNGVDPISKEEIQMVMEVYDRDHGGDFWLGNGYSMFSNSTSVITVRPSYTFSGAALESAKAAFDEKASQILSGITSEMDEYEKALYLHDALAGIVTYEDGANAHNAYGALVEGKAVCQGYAEAYQYLLQQVGIQCYDAVGQSVNPGTGEYENHEWSYVRIDGDYYHIDVTWDDQGEDLYHAYFGLTDATIQEDHIIEAAAYGLPVCDSMDAFYFMGEDSHLGYYDQYNISRLLMHHYGQVHVYISTDAGDAQSFAEWYMANANLIAEQMNLSAYSYGYRELGREFILTLSDPYDTSCKHQNRTVTKAKDPGCVGTGWYEYQTCDDCGQLFDEFGYEIDEIPENNGQGHNYNANGVCTNCGALVGGTCGDNLTWTLADGVLTISGTGPMDDYNSGVAPWNKYREMITKVIVEEGVTSIGGYAFRMYQSLKRVQLPDSLTAIGMMAFQMTALTEVDLPENLTSVGLGAFQNCSQLASVTIPAKTILADRVFRNCTSLTAIDVAPANSAYTDVDGVLYNKDKTVLLCCPGGYVGEFIAEPTTVTVADDAFYGCGKLTAVTFNDGIETIGKNQFWFCESLKDLAFLGDAPANIHDEAFGNLTATAYYPAGNATWTDSVRQNYCGTITWVAQGASGVTVSGTVANFGGATTPVSVSLYQGGVLVQSVTVTGSNAAYNFENVAPGTYTIVISKDGHRTTEQTITVADEDVVQNETLYLMGDVTGDGSVDNLDVMILFRYFTGLDVEVIPGNTDPNGDGSQDNMDVIHLFRYVTGLDVELH